MNWKDPEEVREYKKKYHLEHKEYYREYWKRYREKHKDKIDKKHKEWCQDNKEKLKCYTKKSQKNHPWQVKLDVARARCNNPHNISYKSYGGRGIECLLTSKEIKFLWDRDNAELMIQPSIHRKNNDGNYSLENCEIIEWEEHIRYHKYKK